MPFKNNLFNIGLGIALVLVIILLMTYVAPVITSIITIIISILLPLAIAGVLYYILRPLRDLLEKQKIPRIVAVTIIFCIFIGILIGGYFFIAPLIQSQIAEFIATPQEKIKEVENKTLDLMNFFNFNSVSYEQLREWLNDFVRWALSYITADITKMLTSVATIASYFVLTPFILFYLLKDDHLLTLKIKESIPASYAKNTKKLLSDLDTTLSTYIAGQVLVAFIVGVLIFIGYSFIGLNYALLLAFIAFVFNLIPFCGPIISTIPAILIGLSQSPFMSIKAVIVVLLVHLLDMNLISPKIVGGKLNIHPVTIIILLLFGISTMGILGLFIVIPLYALLKLVFKDFYEMKRSNTEMKDG